MQTIHRLSRRELNTILHFTGNVCMLLAVALLVPLLVALIYNEPRYFIPFIISSIISAVIGVYLVKIFNAEIKMTLRSAMVFSTVIWLVACALGALTILFF